MKTLAIQNEIRHNYKDLISKIAREPEEENLLKFYSLLYNKNCVTEIGDIFIKLKRGADISISLKDGDCKLWKPFYMPQKYAYNKANEVLRYMLQNFGKDCIQQRCARVLCFSPEQAKILMKAADESEVYSADESEGYSADESEGYSADERLLIFSQEQAKILMDAADKSVAYSKNENNNNKFNILKIIAKIFHF